MPSRTFSGQRCLVTGAGHGIGRQLALQFAAAGAAVAVLDRDEAAAMSVVSAIVDQGGTAEAAVVDLANMAKIKPQLEALMASFGPIDILVNNAALVFARAFVDTTPAEFESVLRVNLQAPFICAQVLAPSMMQRRSGRIINVASHSGLRGSTARAAYAASKGGMIAMTRVMAVEFAPYGITVNAIAPGPIETESTRINVSPDRRAAWSGAVPMGRYGSVEEVAAAILFLASPMASYITGQTLAVDGGFSEAGLVVRHVS